MLNRLKLPDEILQNQTAKELMSIWIVDDSQTVVFDSTHWPDPAAWGLLMMDLLKHVSHAYAHEGQFSYEDAFSRAKAGMAAELDFMCRDE
jgi:hypothetical protein